MSALTEAIAAAQARLAEASTALGLVERLASPPAPDPAPEPEPLALDGVNAVRIGSSSYPLAAVDPTSDRVTGDGKRYPGGRGPDELVVYTRPGRTGTNRHGAEASVIDGTVRGDLTGGDGGSVVPDDGATVSGHGRAAAWLQMHGRPGAHVEFVREDMPAPQPKPVPGGRVRMLWHFPAWSGWGGPDPAAYPDDVAKSLTHVSCGVAQSAGPGTGQLRKPDLAAAAALRADGILVGAQIGGSNDGGITVTSSAHADQFVASVASWGVDFADCDLEPSGGKWTHDPMVAALRGCAQATGHGAVVTSGLYTDGGGTNWTERWGQVCKALGDDLAFWVSMNYDFRESANAADLARVVRDKIALMRRYIPDEKIVMAFMPRPNPSYQNASPPGVIPAAYAAALGESKAIGWALWEDKISAATGWADLRALAKL